MPSYAHLLGLYLGDGCVSVRRNGAVTLRISMDRAYPRVVDDCWASLVLSMPESRVTFIPYANERAVYVQACKLWLHAFPQHGPGRKHERKITLEGWQQEIVDAYPDHFVRGLIHSDGCRTINRFKTKLPSGRVSQVPGRGVEVRRSSRR